MGEIQPEKNLLFDCIFYLVNKPLLEAISHILLDWIYLDVSTKNMT